MKTIDLLQCESCKQNLKNFIKLQDETVSEGVVKLLEDYTVYCELSRLKAASKPIVLTTVGNSDFTDSLVINDHTITC